MNDERKQWLKEQLDKFSECQLFNFGSNDGFDIHGDVVDLLAENEALREQTDNALISYNRCEARSVPDMTDAVMVWSVAWQEIQDALLTGGDDAISKT